MMKGSDVVAVCAIGSVIGMLMIVILGSYTGVIPRGRDAVMLIEECQKDLRRDEYCTIIAVPTDEVEED